MSTYGSKATQPAAFRFGANGGLARARWAVPIATGRHSHVHEARRAQRRAGFLGQRIGPRFAVAKRFRCATKRTIKHCAGWCRMIADRRQFVLNGATRDDAATRSLPHPRRVAEYSDTDAFTGSPDHLHSEQTALQFRQMAMPRAHLFQSGANRTGRNPIGRRQWDGAGREH